MKTAEDWIVCYNWSGQTFEQIKFQIKAIQLDAWRQGMTDAAEECVKQGAARSSIDCYNAILKARDTQPLTTPEEMK